MVQSSLDRGLGSFVGEPRSGINIALERGDWQDIADYALMLAIILAFLLSTIRLIGWSAR